MNAALTIAGLVLLLAGGEALVRGAVSVARRFGLSPLVIGLTVVGFGTSIPELVVGVNAALAGAPGITVGNVIGSNMANMMLILGVAAAIAGVSVSTTALGRDGLMMVAATVAFAAVGVSGTAELWHGVLLVAALGLYLAYSLHSDHGAGGGGERSGALWMPLLLVLGGIAGLMAGAELLVQGAVGIARAAEIPDEVIGLTLIAIGTSLPELATTIVAALRRQTDICLGNVLGSNIFNLLGVMGVAAVVTPISFPPGIVAYDLWALVAMTALLMVFLLTGRRVSRGEGAVLLALYAAYVASQF
jgi:cation:H+ antiporter